MLVLLQHRNHFGDAEINWEKNCLQGSLINIQTPVHYWAYSAPGFILAFREAVDDYIENHPEDAASGKTDVMPTDSAQLQRLNQP